MKKKPDANPLCLSCRRVCKQPAAVCISTCPRYYPFPKIRKYEFQQLELGF